VTTVRDPNAAGGADIAMRDLINMGAMVGPRMFVSGPGLRSSANRPGVADPAAEAAKQAKALLASGQINMRKVDGWQSLATKPIDQPIDLAA